jgi:hypothetical protein
MEIEEEDWRGVITMIINENWITDVGISRIMRNTRTASY